MNDSTPISCHAHDYIEIACLYGFEIELSLRDGSTVHGKARTTVTREGKREFLVVGRGDGDVDVELRNIVAIKAVTENPHFGRVEF